MPATLLQQIYSALSEKNRRHIHADQLAAVEDQILARGWIYRIELEELLLETDSRGVYLDWCLLAAYFELPWRQIFKRPRFLSAGDFSHDGLALPDAACLFVRLEEMGFDSYPERLVGPGLRAQKDLTHITDSEWTLLSYPKRRFREQFTACSDRHNDDGEWIPRYWKDARGRRIEFTLIGDQPYLLTVTGPKYRRPRPRIQVTCETCGYTHTKGDPESELSHRSEHARVMRYMTPRPLAEFRARIASRPHPELVTVDSPIWMHREVHQRALQFKRDFQYDFCQWEGTNRTKNPNPQSHAYLFSDHTGQFGESAIVGACAFWREGNHWRLRWVWVCPVMRRMGVLARRWPLFLEQYGDFSIEPPLSDAMQKFIFEHGTQAQKDGLERLQGSASGDQEPTF